MNPTFRKNIIEKSIALEGGYVNDPIDAGSETIWGITKAVARENEYTAPMKDMTKEQAINIYLLEFWIPLQLDKIAEISMLLCHEIFDTAINVGKKPAVKYLQRVLNVFNKDEVLYNNLFVDGLMGENTLMALQSYLEKRKRNSLNILLKAYNCLQGAAYIALAEKDKKQERFIYGWINYRVFL